MAENGRSDNIMSRLITIIRLDFKFILEAMHDEHLASGDTEYKEIISPALWKSLHEMDITGGASGRTVFTHYDDSFNVNDEDTNANEKWFNDNYGHDSSTGRDNQAIARYILNSYACGNKQRGTYNNQKTTGYDPSKTRATGVSPLQMYNMMHGGHGNVATIGRTIGKTAFLTNGSVYNENGIRQAVFTDDVNSSVSKMLLRNGKNSSSKLVGDIVTKLADGVGGRYLTFDGVRKLVIGTFSTLFDDNRASLKVFLRNEASGVTHYFGDAMTLSRKSEEETIEYGKTLAKLCLDQVESPDSALKDGKGLYSVNFNLIDNPDREFCGTKDVFHVFCDAMDYSGYVMAFNKAGTGSVSAETSVEGKNGSVINNALDSAISHSEGLGSGEVILSKNIADVYASMVTGFNLLAREGLFNDVHALRVRDYDVSDYRMAALAVSNLVKTSGIDGYRIININGFMIPVDSGVMEMLRNSNTPKSELSVEVADAAKKAILGAVAAVKPEFLQSGNVSVMRAILNIGNFIGSIIDEYCDVIDTDESDDDTVANAKQNFKMLNPRINYLSVARFIVANTSNISSYFDTTNQSNDSYPYKNVVDVLAGTVKRIEIGRDSDSGRIIGYITDLTDLPREKIVSALNVNNMSPLVYLITKVALEKVSAPSGAPLSFVELLDANAQSTTPFIGEMVALVGNMYGDSAVSTMYECLNAIRTNSEYDSDALANILRMVNTTPNTIMYSRAIRTIGQDEPMNTNRIKSMKETTSNRTQAFGGRLGSARRRR